MSAPQLADANTSSEWFRTVADAGADGKARSPSQAAIPNDRRKRFVRLVTYTMVGLVAFTLLGVASFAVRQHSMQSALSAPAPLAAAVPVLPAAAPQSIADTTPPSPAAEAPATNAKAVAPAVAPRATVKKTTAAAAKPGSKVAKKAATRSPFLSSR